MPATIYWLGRAQAIVQVVNYLVTAPIVAAEVFSVTINAKTVSFMATTTTAAHVAAGLQAALAASTIAEFKEFTWTSDGAYLIGTAKVAGWPHTITIADDSAGGSFTLSSTTAATGPEFWNNVDNWLGGVVPVTGDSIVLANSDKGIKHGWPGSAVALADVNVQPTFTGGVGLPEISVKGYREYRPTFPTNITFTTGSIDASGCERFNVNGLEASAVVNFSGGVVFMKGSVATSIIDINGGTTLTLGGPGLTATASIVRVSNGASLTLHKDATIATLYSSGTTFLEGVVATMYNLSGNGVSAKNPAATHITGGTLKLNGSETITALSIGPGTLDLSEDLSTFAVTALTIRKGCRLTNPHDRITGTTTATLDLVTDLRA